MKKFFEMFLGPDNETSSKRIMGTILIACGLVKAFASSDSVMALGLISTGVSLFIAAAATHT